MQPHSVTPNSRIPSTYLRPALAGKELLENQNPEQVTIGNYREVAGQINGNPPEKLFITEYFETLERGKPPTIEILTPKIRKITKANIEEVKSSKQVVNRSRL